MYSKNKRVLRTQTKRYYKLSRIIQKVNRFIGRKLHLIQKVLKIRGIILRAIEFKQFGVKPIKFKERFFGIKQPKLIFPPIKKRQKVKKQCCEIKEIEKQGLEIKEVKIQEHA